MEPHLEAHKSAQLIVETFPILGRLIATHMRESGDEEATLMQVSVLMSIHEQPVTTSVLAKQRKVSLQSASVLVQSLVEKGWLTRVPDPNDRRQALLQVTPEGMACARAVHEQIIQKVADVLAELTAEELAAAMLFLPGLQRVTQKHMQPEQSVDS